MGLEIWEVWDGDKALLSDSAQVKASHGNLLRLVICTAGSAGATISIYDALTATGTPIVIDGTAVKTIELGVRMGTGIYVALAGSPTKPTIAVIYK